MQMTREQLKKLLVSLTEPKQRLDYLKAQILIAAGGSVQLLRCVSETGGRVSVCQDYKGGKREHMCCYTFGSHDDRTWKSFSFVLSVKPSKNANPFAQFRSIGLISFTDGVLQYTAGTEPSEAFLDEMMSVRALVAEFGGVQSGGTK
jgi:hypothetical protein